MGQTVANGTWTPENISEDDLVWTDLPEGIFFRKMPYLWPINAPNSWLLNIAKVRTHAMGVTLTAKGLQGALAMPYVHHCESAASNLGVSAAHLNPNYINDINANYNRHRAAGIPRWDKPGSGLAMEAWASRNTDNNTALKEVTGLHIVEGIFGYSEADKLKTMLNYIVFGKISYHVDIVLHWLTGHEPGNFGLFHLAKERGLAETINPMNIPVYEWKADGSAILTPLNQFACVPLKTNYLQRNYSGGTEAEFHLVNEPYEYPAEPPLGVSERAEPRAFVLRQNHPNPFNPHTSIEYIIPKGGNIRLEVYNSSGQLVDVLADGYRTAGSHLAVWKAHDRASGTYFYRFRHNGYSETGKMILLK
jgi:hypothetical protein